MYLVIARCSIVLSKIKNNHTKKEVTELLNELGLNKYESLVYFNLISEGISTAKNVSDISGIPYGKVYEIINSLSEKGFCTILPSKPMKCQAVSPKHSLNSFKKNTVDRLSYLENQFNILLEPIYEKTRAFNNTESKILVINGRYNVIKKIDEQIKKSEKNIKIYCSANSLSRLIIHTAALREAQKRGVEINIVGEINKKNKEEIIALSFCNLKNTKKAVNNFFSFDNHTTLLVEPLPDDEDIKYGRDTAICMASSSYTFLLNTFFENTLKLSKTAVLESSDSDFIN